MNILVIGNPQNQDECRQKFGGEHSYELSNRLEPEKTASIPDVVFDFLVDPGSATAIHSKIEGAYFIDATQMSLAEYQSKVGPEIQTLFGFAGLPTFLNREVLEVSCKATDIKKLELVCAHLKTAFQAVDDRIGLVTPRVICMIINEAYFTVQEGIATREDIDLAMRLGTNYPRGPFEWCQEIGVQNVWHLLEAVYADTKDSRYQVCPLLETESLQNGGGAGKKRN